MRITCARVHSCHILMIFHGVKLITYGNAVDESSECTTLRDEFRGLKAAATRIQQQHYYFAFLLAGADPSSPFSCTSGPDCRPRVEGK